MRVATSPEDIALCQTWLQEEHCLGQAKPAGQRLWQIITRVVDEKPVAIALWAASALHLKPRDAWIGWDGMRRSQRLGLIVNNSRFLVLEAQREPNLASQALGAALRALPDQWLAVAGYRPLLAEAFTDIETHTGTLYRCTNWTPLDHTKGFQRHRADFYVPHDRPKKLWVKELVPQARELLCAPELPAAYALAEIAPTVRSVLNVPEMRSLMEVFEQMPDPRPKANRRYGLPLMLLLLSLGLLSGAATLNGILRSVRLLSQVQRKALGLRKKPGKEVRAVPCYNAFRTLIAKLDLERFEQLLATWLSQHEGHLPRTLAMDGKSLGSQIGIIVSLINTTHCASQGPEAEAKSGSHYDGTATPPVALHVEQSGSEQAAVQTILANPVVQLVEATVTADALHCQAKTLHQIVAQKGADYFISLKDNQPTAAAYARDQLAHAPLFASAKRKTTDALPATK